MVLSLDAQLVDDLGHQAVDDAVGAAGAVVERRIGQGLRVFSNTMAIIFAPPIMAFFDFAEHLARGGNHAAGAAAEARPGYGR